jgi:hypothetical protein
MLDENNGFQFGWLDLLPLRSQSVLLNKYSAIADLYNLEFTVAHALGFSVSTSRHLATDLNTEPNTSNHSEVFLPFLVQSPWNADLGTQLKTLLDSQVFIASEFTSRISTLRYTKSESESELLYDWRFTANQFVVAPSPLRLTSRIIFFLNWTPAVIVLI